MKLSREEVQAIARLARLDLNDQDITMYAEQLSVVLEYVEMLAELNTDEVPETTQVTGLTDVFREDLVVETDPGTKRALLEAFPHRAGAFLKVRAVFDDTSDQD